MLASFTFPGVRSLQLFEHLGMRLSPHKNFAWWAVTWRTAQTTVRTVKIGGGLLRVDGRLPGTLPIYLLSHRRSSDKSSTSDAQQFKGMELKWQSLI